jgi:hypothetical protein
MGPFVGVCGRRTEIAKPRIRQNHNPHAIFTNGKAVTGRSRTQSLSKGSIQFAFIDLKDAHRYLKTLLSAKVRRIDCLGICITKAFL